MTSKHFGWHAKWSRDASGHLQHVNGLRILMLPGDGFVDLETDDASLAIFNAHESSRGVPAHQIIERVQRLLKEAEQWHQRNP